MTAEQQSRMNKPKGSEQSHTSQQKITAAFTSKIRSKSFEQILSNFITVYNQYGPYKDEIKQLTFVKFNVDFKFFFN